MRAPAAPERAGMSELWLARLTKSLKSSVLLDAGAFSELKMSESQPPRLTKSLKSPAFLDAGAFSRLAAGCISTLV